MSGRYFNCGGIKRKLSVKFYIYDIALLRTVCQFVKNMFEIQFISNNSLSLNSPDCYRYVTQVFFCDLISLRGSKKT